MTATDAISPQAPSADPRRRDRWLWPVLVLTALQIAAWAVPQTRPGTAGIFWWAFGQEVFPFLARVMLGVTVVWSLIRRPFWQPRRRLRFALLTLVAVSPVLFFHVYPSSHEGYRSQVRFRLPLDGPVTVFWGGNRLEQNYHVDYPDQRWAYDLVVTKDGKSYSGDGKRHEDYYCYGMPVLAPAAGVVRKAEDGHPEKPPGELGGEPAGGNHVVIEVAPKEYLVLCHMQPGSLVVKVGDEVKAGQVIGKCGNSGNTSEPHVHVHLQDSLEDAFAEGIPLYFSGYRVDGQLVNQGMPTGGEKPQIVEHVSPTTPAGSRDASR